MRHFYSLSPLLVFCLLLTACQTQQETIVFSEPPVTPTTLPEPTQTPVARPTASPPAASPTQAPPTTAVAENPFDGLRISELSQRSYGGPGINVGEEVVREAEYSRYIMTYESDDLLIGGRINIPVGRGPFPVIIVNHGYLAPEVYEPSAGTWRIADWLALRGYIAIMSDYRNYGDSEHGPNPFHIGYAIDVMNLVAQVESLPMAAPGQIGIIGHSMGGEISMWPLVISDEVDAVVLYASMSGDVVKNWEYGVLNFPVQRPALDALALIYGTPDEHSEEYAALSPVNYLDQVRMPVLIQHGMLDEIVPYVWSEELAAQMAEAGLDVTFYAYGGGGHALRGQMFETFMERNLDFFETNVKANINQPAVAP